jgi:hypothetical protein
MVKPRSPAAGFSVAWVILSVLIAAAAAPGMAVAATLPSSSLPAWSRNARRFITSRMPSAPGLFREPCFQLGILLSERRG